MNSRTPRWCGQQHIWGCPGGWGWYKAGTASPQRVAHSRCTPTSPSPHPPSGSPGLPEPKELCSCGNRSPAADFPAHLRESLEARTLFLQMEPMISLQHLKGFSSASPARAPERALGLLWLRSGGRRAACRRTLSLSAPPPQAAFQAAAEGWSHGTVRRPSGPRRQQPGSSRPLRLTQGPVSGNDEATAHLNWLFLRGPRGVFGDS